MNTNKPTKVNSDFFLEVNSATRKILRSGNFDPYNGQKNYFRGLPNGATINQFEVYWNMLLIANLNAKYSRNSIIGFEHRRFDLKRKNGRIWEVMEFGHEKSSRGYLNNNKGEPNNQGLVNKLFFDYLKNYQFLSCNPCLNPKSYAYLYFTLEDNGNRKEMDKLFKYIRSLYPTGHRIKIHNVSKNNIMVGRIMIIDFLRTLRDVKKIYKKHRKNLINYIAPVEDGWQKDDMLSS